VHQSDEHDELGGRFEAFPNSVCSMTMMLVLKKKFLAAEQLRSVSVTGTPA
jgi:hypothetical protein